MTVIAYDGRTLAADKRATCSGLAVTATKIRRLESGEVMAYTGDQDTGEILMQWYECGADPLLWPTAQQSSKNWTRLIVADADGCKFFEQRHIAIAVEDAFAAWGSGRDFAIAALHCGKSAREAVEVASAYCITCGNGVDSFDL